MKILAGALLLLLVASSRCAEVRRLSAEQLQRSDLWKDDSQRLLLFPEQANVPVEYLQTLERLNGVTTKPCSDGSQLCSLLSSSPMVARSNGAMWGVQLSTEGMSTDEFAAKALEALFGSSLSYVNSYYQYEDIVTSHPHHFVLLISNTHSQEYIALLTALLSFPQLPFPLVVTTAMETLPLSRRPIELIQSLLPTRPPFHLWFVGQRDWYECWDTLDLPGDTRGVVTFVRRTAYPDIVIYTGKDSIAGLAESEFYTAYLFESVELDIGVVERVAIPLATRLYKLYIFVVVNRSSEVGTMLATEFGVNSPATHPHITVVPPGLDKTKIVQLSSNEVGDIHEVTDKLYAITLGKKGTVLTLQPASLDVLIQGKEHILAGFCKKGSAECTQQHQKVDKVLELCQQLAPRSLLNVVMAMVHCDSEEIAKKYNVDMLPALSLYNTTTKMWGVLEGDNALAKFLAFVRSTAEVAAEMEKEKGPNWPPVVQVPSPLIEDDQFGMVFSTLSPLTISQHLYLKDKTFVPHITSHQITLVVFFFHWDVRSAVFLYHFKAAVDHLDNAHEGSLALVDCDAQSDVCTKHSISKYPSARIYRGSVDSFTDYDGILDSTHLLNAIGQETLPTSTDDVLELRPDTLPSLLHGHLDMPLIVWCDTALEGRRGEDFTTTARSKKYQQFTFTWMNSNNHSKLLQRMVEGLDFPALLALDFMKHEVYKLSGSSIATDQFQLSLQQFLTQLSEGTLTPSGSLGGTGKVWPPNQPPILFPSTEDAGTGSFPPYSPLEPPSSSDPGMKMMADQEPMSTTATPHSHTEL